MEDLKWLWDYLKDVYKEPSCYYNRNRYFKWMSYTSSFVDILKEYVLKNRRRIGVDGAILNFQSRFAKMKNLEMAIAANTVAQTALEVWTESIY